MRLALVWAAAAIFSGPVTRGDLVPLPASQLRAKFSVAAPQTMSLDGDGWRLRNSNGSIDVPASVPGDAHSALQAAGIIEDINFRDNSWKYSWVGQNENWTWSRNLTVPQRIGDQVAMWTLVCDGLQTRATVWFKGQLLGRAANQYRRWMFALPAGTGELALCFTSIYAESPCMWVGACRPVYTHLDLAVSTSIRQEYLSWGRTGVENDYQPLEGTFPQGPWESVFMVATTSRSSASSIKAGHATLASVLVTDVVVQTSSRPANPVTRLEESDNEFGSTITVHLRAAVASQHVVSVSGNWSTGAIATRTMLVPVGVSNATFMLTAKNVELWWPNGLGQQKLYKIEVRVNSGEVKTERLVGFRSLVFVNRQFDKKDGVTSLGYTGKPRLFYRVNGIELFARGGNFVTMDMLESRATKARYRGLLQSCADANFVILRINGDSNYMKDEFYDIADELGILLHHEFMLSDTDYTPAVLASEASSDPLSFLPNVRAEVEHQVRRLAHHPSVAMWVGNNEIMSGQYNASSPTSWYRLFIDNVMDAVIANDVSRPIWPTSASDGWASGVDDETQLLLPGNSTADLVVRCASDNPKCGDPSPKLGREGHNYYFENAVGDGFDSSIYPDLSLASEFGWVGMMSYEAMKLYTNGTDRNFLSTYMNRSNGSGKHHFQPDGGGKAGVIRARVAWNFPLEEQNFGSDDESKFRRLCYLSQLVQALCLAGEAAHFRRGRELSPGLAKAAGTMGSMYWTVNSDYPGLDWGSLDLDGRWRLTHHMIQQVYSPLALTALVTSKTVPKLAQGSPPPPAPAMCRLNTDMCATASTFVSKPTHDANACCSLCATIASCKAYTFDAAHGECYLSNSTGYDKPDSRPLISGRCAGGACNATSCGLCSHGVSAASGTLVVHAANDRLLEPAHTSQFLLRVIRFEDGAFVVLPIQPNTIPTQSGKMIFSEPVGSVLRQGHCATAGDCCAVISAHPNASVTQVNTDGGFVIFTHFPDLNLQQANVTANVSAIDSTLYSSSSGRPRLSVDLESDAVALFVTLTSSVFGRFDRNGILLLPGEPQRLQFTGWEKFTIGEFRATLDIQGVNVV